jgi:hypothetical protein
MPVFGNLFLFSFHGTFQCNGRYLKIGVTQFGLIGFTKSREQQAAGLLKADLPRGHEALQGGRRQVTMRSLRGQGG